jgi:hypothetical protein
VSKAYELNKLDGSFEETGESGEKLTETPASTILDLISLQKVNQSLSKFFVITARFEFLDNGISKNRIILTIFEYFECYAYDLIGLLFGEFITILFITVVVHVFLKLLYYLLLL